MLTWLTLAALAAPAAPPAQEVARHTWVLQDGAQNQLVAQLRDGTVLVVDSPTSPSAQRELLSFVDALAPSRVVVLNTHHEPDAVAMNGTWLERSAEVWSSRETAALVARDGGPPANNTFREEWGKRLRFGATRVEIWHPGAGHTEDNNVVWLRGRSVLFAGDLLTNDGQLDVTERSDLTAWPSAVNNLSRYEPLLVVPGRGPAYDSALRNATPHLLRLAAQDREAVSSAPQADGRVRLWRTE